MERNIKRDLFIGTSGFDYPEWRGSFYPSDLKRADFLAYYAQCFNALELNFSFYQLPSKDQLLSFYDRSCGKVFFSVKANRSLTHDVSSSWRYDAAQFCSALEGLIENNVLLTVLFQFPQSFHYTVENRCYLSSLLAQFNSFPVAVEFRHREWVRPSVFAGLSSRNASLVFCDMPSLSALPGHTPFVGSDAYIRLHGRNGNAWYARDRGPSARYLYDYSENELESFVPVVNNALESGKRVQLYFNNHPKGHGAKNALALKALLCTE